MAHTIFMYGTLKQTEKNHVGFLEFPGWMTYLGRAVTADIWPLVITPEYHMPCLLDTQGVGKIIRGELYEIDDEKLETLDNIECKPGTDGKPTWYTRLPILVRRLPEPGVPDSSPVLCSSYRIQTPSQKLLGLPYEEEYDSSKPHMEYTVENVLNLSAEEMENIRRSVIG